MAGSEREGFTHASSEIFKGRNYLFMDPIIGYSEYSSSECQIALSTIKEIAIAIGFTRLIDTTPEIHDHKIAFTSQLCHVIASSLVDSAEDTDITAFGGGSYEDLTRIAMINAPLWTELFLSNKDELIRHISKFQDSLRELKDCIECSKKEDVVSYLENVRQRRISMAQPKV